VSCSLYEESLFREAAGTEFRPGGLNITEELAVECRLKPGEHLLDLGCGVGSTASFLRRRWGVTAVGLDCSAGFIEEARNRDTEVTWIVGQADRIPYPNGYFDCVFSECFLTTLADPTVALHEMKRVLRPGGRLAMTDVYLRNPEAASSLGSLSSATCLRGAVGADEMRALLVRTGFAVRTWRDRSDVLKTLVASLILTYGSTAAFSDAALGESEGIWEAATSARPGYCLLVAEPQPAAPCVLSDTAIGALESRHG
jgi:arsenite methyltransferase